MTNQTENTGQTPYRHTIKGVTFDYYDLADAIDFEQEAVAHAFKKLMALGKRSGNKSYGQDLHEAIMSLFRAQEQYNESLRSTAGRTPSQVTLPIIAPLPAICSNNPSKRYDDQSTRAKDYFANERGGSPDDGVEEALLALEAWAKTFNKGS